MIRFTTRPTVLVSTTINPLVTFTGRMLEQRWDWISVSVIPCANGGWAIFTWDQAAPKNPSLFVKSLKTLSNRLLKTALVCFIVESSENSAIAPHWWESRSLERRNELIYRFGLSIRRGFNKPGSDTLVPPKTPWADWNPVEAKYVSD